ncbi:guanylate kinase [Lapidilactobacillus mulanensis]|uniref:Guanylate kinase n=1 Tax=Lapidilactobacillus mulanensis TaxID=2485999 RepID=A0ABW4DM65_9LACO|nr:AAA family ATPase [Lapidilactobacillus mulanensis]
MGKAVTNKLFVITGASGTGKTTISHYLRDNYGIQRVLTHTTRPPRPNEANERDYYFETEDGFQKNHYIESVTYSGYHYGSSREALQKAWQQQPFVSLVLETKGAEAYADVMLKQLVVIYVTVSDPQVLLARLEKRGDVPAEIEKRLSSAEFKRDLEVPPALVNIAHVIVNDTWEQARAQVDQLLKLAVKSDLKLNANK